MEELRIRVSVKRDETFIRSLIRVIYLRFYRDLCKQRRERGVIKGLLRSRRDHGSGRGEE